MIRLSPATKPFGAIDTPAYGQTVTGSFWNCEWALTPNANNSDPRSCTITDGNVQMAIDSGPLTPVIYGGARPDIASAFPGFSNGASGGGAFYLDVSGIANGVHSIGGWSRTAAGAPKPSAAGSSRWPSEGRSLDRLIVDSPG
jgi:hypothetical protein